MINSHRKLPVGIQSFSKIREGRFLYVDKTDVVWDLVNNGKQYNYLSRPRRFGKSVLVDTLQCYFEGRRDLFEGLKIMNLEKDWIVRPVIRFDMSCGGAGEKSLRSYFDSVFREYEKNTLLKFTRMTRFPFDLMQLSLLHINRPVVKWQYLLMSMTHHCNTRGIHRNMSYARLSIKRYLQY